MERLKVAVVGGGSIAQIVHLPVLKHLDDVELVALCDVDQGKVNVLTEKFDIPRWYYLIDDLVKNETLDAVYICSPSHYHYPMTYLALNNGINVFVEKPLALNAADAGKLAELAAQKNRHVMVGMQNRFRDDVITLRNFIQNDELGEIFYIKTGWLKKWSRKALDNKWLARKEYSGGGVLIDLGTQLIDLALFLNGLPAIKSVRLYDYNLDPNLEVEDSALAVIETVNHVSITVEVSWRMHLDRDVIYTHLFGKKGSAYLNPLRIQKELHGNLVNVNPMMVNVKSSAERYKKAYEAEIRHFSRVIRGEEENQSSAADAYYVMRIPDALYQSARSGREVLLTD